MRKFLPLCLLAICCSFLTAQTDPVYSAPSAETPLLDPYARGTWFLDVNSSLAMDSNGFDSDGPGVTVGLFVTRNLMVGSQLRFDEVDFDPFLRYYLPGQGRTRFFGEAGLDLATRQDVSALVFAGIGLERQLADGVMAFASFRYTVPGGGEGGAGRFALEGGLNARFGQPWSPEAGSDFAGRGAWLVRGNFRLALSDSRTIDFNTIDLDLAVDYFLTDRFAVEAELTTFGTEVLFNQSSAFRESRIYRTSVTASFGGSYFFRSGKKLRPYLGAGLALETLVNERNRGDGLSQISLRNTDTEFTAFGKAGALYQLTDRLVLDADLRLRLPTDIDDAPFGGRVGLKVSLGKR